MNEISTPRTLSFGFRQFAVSLAIAAATFVVLGTVAALWKNPLFIRMMPPTGFEIALLAAQAVLVGIYLAMPAPACAARSASIGGVMGFLGIACPICNKLLVLTLGPALLMQYFEPIRLYVGLLGLVIIAFALWRRAGGFPNTRLLDPLLTARTIMRQGIR